jgi:hypothetical protein
MLNSCFKASLPLMEAGTPVSPRCHGQRSRLGGAVHGSEADTVDSISGAQAYDRKTRAEYEPFSLRIYSRERRLNQPRKPIPAR